MLNFAALAFAPASILTSLESIQFVTNVAYNKLINGVHVSREMLLGVLLACLGTTLTVVFGAQTGGTCRSVEEMSGYWGGAAWWAYLSTTIVLAPSICSSIASLSPQGPAPRTTATFPSAAAFSA